MKPDNTLHLYNFFFLKYLLHWRFVSEIQAALQPSTPTPLCSVSFPLEPLPPLQNSQVIQSYHPLFRLFFC